MTKKMKRSEFLDKCRSALEDEAFRQPAETFVYLAEQAGMEWLPEEPELPERLMVIESRDTSALLVLDETSRLAIRAFCLGRVDLDTLRESIACYNFVRRVIATKGREPIDMLWLEEEREKVRTP